MLRMRAVKKVVAEPGKPFHADSMLDLDLGNALRHNLAADF